MWSAIELGVLSCFVLLGLKILRDSYTRSANDVLFDLGEEIVSTSDASEGEDENTDNSSKRSEREFVQAGMSDREEQRKFRRFQKLLPVVCIVLALALKQLVAPNNMALFIPFATLGLAVGYLVPRYVLNSRIAQYKRQIDFYLPVVMERMVMAVQAGNDVIAATRAIFELEEGKGDKKDPVTQLVQRAYQLSEVGVPFDRALEEVATDIESPCLRHAFIHLAQAHREGGELVTALRELSDSTQLYYQESTEESIAKLPVKATAPLVLIFTGLLIFFLTSPLIQIMSVAGGGMGL